LLKNPRSPFESPGTGAELEMIEYFPFMLRPVEAFPMFFSNLLGGLNVLLPKVLWMPPSQRTNDTGRTSRSVRGFMQIEEQLNRDYELGGMLTLRECSTVFAP
jgi:hypothetical protein